MKKYLAVLAVTMFTIGLTSCEPESTTDDPTENILSPDKDKAQCTGCDHD